MHIFSPKSVKINGADIIQNSILVYVYIIQNFYWLK